MNSDSDNRKQVELARRTLKVFEDHGEDMTEVRHVVHYMYGGNLSGLAAALAELGYRVRSTINDDGVVAEREEAIGETWRTTTLLHLCELADSYGVEYDGWEASMTRPGGSCEEPPQAAKPSGWLKIFGRKS